MREVCCCGIGTGRDRRDVACRIRVELADDRKAIYWAQSAPAHSCRADRSDQLGIYDKPRLPYRPIALAAAIDGTARLSGEV